MLDDPSVLQLQVPAWKLIQLNTAAGFLIYTPNFTYNSQSHDSYLHKDFVQIHKIHQCTCHNGLQWWNHSCNHIFQCFCYKLDWQNHDDYIDILEKKEILKGPIVYFIKGRSRSRHKWRFLHFTGAFMEHFLEGSARVKALVSKLWREDLYLLTLCIWVNVPMS